MTRWSHVGSSPHRPPHPRVLRPRACSDLRPCRRPPGSPRGFVMNWTDCCWAWRCLFIHFWSSPLFLLSLIIHLSTINFFWSKFISYLFRESVCQVNFLSAENIHHGYRFVPLWSLMACWARSLGPTRGGHAPCGPSGMCACPAEAWARPGGPCAPSNPVHARAPLAQLPPTVSLPASCFLIIYFAKYLLLFSILLGPFLFPH